jgi:hypothetical protein
MKTFPLIAVQVHRDAMTKIPAFVPAHELRVLRAVHGKDNVYPIPDVEAGSVELDPAAEGSRLREKYGEGAVVAAYGEGFDEAIFDAVSSADSVAKPKGKAAVPA